MRTKFGIVMVGKTHSGKSRLGRQLHRHLSHSLLIQPEGVAALLAKSYPRLHFYSYLKRHGIDQPILTYRLYYEITRLGLELGYNVILTNNHLRKEWRKKTITLLRHYKTKVIIVFLDLPKSILLQRISKSKAQRDFLFKCTNYKDLLLRCHNLIEEKPSSKEGDYFFHVTKTSDVRLVYNKIRKICRGLR